MLEQCRAVSRSVCCVALRLLRRAVALGALLLLQALGAAGYAHAVNIERGPEPGAPGIADGRAYEQVSPPDKNGNQAGPPAQGGSSFGVTSASGDRVLYSSTGPIGEASSGVDNFSVSTRSATAWTTRAALPQPPEASRDLVSPFDPVWLLPSADLSGVVFTAHNPFTAAPLDFSNPEFSFIGTFLSHEGEATEWLGDPTVGNPFPALEEVEAPADLVLAGASADLSVVYFEYYGILVPEDAPRRATVVGGELRAWGLYEWRDGRLKAVGLLPPKEVGEEEKEDPYGAVAAGVSQHQLTTTPADFDNEVSSSGNTALFVSPVPQAESGRAPELYARLNGDETVLVSRSAITGMPSEKGPASVNGLTSAHIPAYAFGSPDGSQVLFTSHEQLTDTAPADTTAKEYRFDLATRTLSYLPEVTAPILGSSADAGTLVFDDTGSSENTLAVFADGHTTDIATLPAPGEGQLTVSPVRLSADAKSLVFQTNAPIAGFNNGHSYGEVYRYDLGTEGLSCVSCPPEGQAPTGSAELSNDALHHLTHVGVDSRGISEDGSEIFFDTPDALVPEDKNETRDVYEWKEGRISLISKGEGSAESFFLDNSPSGEDVFFATRDDLTGSDSDGSYDVYDARVRGGFSSPSPPVACSGCRSSLSAVPQALASSSLLGAGEQVPAEPSTHTAGKPKLSRAQKLARSLKSCRKRRGKRRHACEAQARRRYGTHAAAKRS